MFKMSLTSHYMYFLEDWFWLREKAITSCLHELSSRASRNRFVVAHQTCFNHLPKDSRSVDGGAGDRRQH